MEVRMKGLFGWLPAKKGEVVDTRDAEIAKLKVELRKAQLATAKLAAERSAMHEMTRQMHQSLTNYHILMGDFVNNLSTGMEDRQVAALVQGISRSIKENEPPTPEHVVAAIALADSRTQHSMISQVPNLRVVNDA